MAINLTQSPGDYNLVYGPNAVTLQNIGTLDRKYVLQIKRGNELIADIRQLPNTAGAAIFDIQNILQSFVKQSRGDIEDRANFTTSENETMYYQLHCGSELLSGGVNIDVVTTVRVAMGGTKPYYEIQWDSSDVTPILSKDEAATECTLVDQVASALTDMPVYTQSQFSVTGKGGFPPTMNVNTPIYNIKLTEDDNHTISYWNLFQPGQSGAPQIDTKQTVEAIEVMQFNGAQIISADVIQNTIPNGGGPNVAIGDGIVPQWPYYAVTFGSGPKNGSFTLSNMCTHYYVYPRAHSPITCTPGALSSFTATPLRVDIVDNNCLDYDHYEFSWTNSYGFRDYFLFTKKNQKKVSITRNNYFKEAADYASTSYQVDKYDRGTTTYSQLLKETYTATTDYLTDVEAAYLERLFTSPDTRVKIGDEWQPVAALSKSYTQKTYQKDQLFQYTINFELAHPIKSQRG